MKGRPSSRKRPAFGERLAAVRIECGLTQQSLATKLRISRTLIRYYEREARDPKVSVVLKCATALEVPIEVLIGPAQRNEARLDPLVARFAYSLMAFSTKQRALAVHIFSQQLPQFSKRGRRSNERAR